VRIRARQLREAQSAAERALSLAPDSAEALYLLGTVAHTQGNPTAALSYYAKALQAQPAHTEALVSRAGLLMDQGRMPDAATDVAQLLRTAPNDPRGAYLKALIAEREGKSAEAKAALNEVTALLDPVPIEFLRYRPQALMLGGLSHYGLNQREKAKPYLEAVQRSYPNGGVSKLLAQIYLSEKSFDRAISALETYLRVQPGDPQAQLLLASVHMAQGRYARATVLMQEALRSQDRPELRTMLGMSLVGGGKFGDAAAQLKTTFDKDPSQVQAGVALATLYMQSGQTAQALAVAESLARQRPGSAGVQNLLGSARARRGDVAGAKAAFEAALKLDATFAAPQVNLARLDGEAKAYDKATARLNAVLSRDEKNVDALMELSRIAERRAQLSEAQRWLEKADDDSAPGNLQAGLALVEFQLRNGNAAAALEASKRLTARAPEAMPVMLVVAQVRLANGDAAAARTVLTRAATLAGTSPTPLLRIAMLQLRAGDLPGAAYSLGKALSEQPDFLPAQALMAEVEMRQGELAQAEQRVRQIVASHPKAGVGYGLQGDLAAMRGQAPVAAEAYRRAHQIEQSSASLLRLHRALSVSDAAAAQRLADQWLKSHPQDVAVRRAVADGHARAGKLEAAKAGYEAMLKVVPDDAEALNNLANVMLLAGDPAALKVAEQAMALQPTVPHIIGTAGWAAFKAGQTDRSLQLLRDARLRDPSNPNTRYFLAAVLASAGRKTEAREELESALRGGATFVSAKDAEQLLSALR
jgi:putative PEP-CTERM system TPR-repeat lipoprotein